MSGIELDGKTAWITGASSGIGRHIALDLARRGCNVALSARSRDDLEQVANECEGARTGVFPLDVTNKFRTNEVVEEIESEFHGLDLAIFNAGTYSRFSEPINSESFEKDVEVNYLGLVYCIEACLPVLKESDVGHIFGMSSASAYTPLPRAASYGASKSAVKYMIESLRLEWDRKGVEVGLSVICPGFVKTPMTADNEFDMPFLMEPEDASEIILNGITSRKKEIHFPLPLVMTLKIVSCFPAFIREPLVSYLTE